MAKVASADPRASARVHAARAAATSLRVANSHPSAYSASAEPASPAARNSASRAGDVSWRTVASGGKGCLLVQDRLWVKCAPPSPSCSEFVRMSWGITASHLDGRLPAPPWTSPRKRATRHEGVTPTPVPRTTAAAR